MRLLKKLRIIFMALALFGIGYYYLLGLNQDPERIRELRSNEMHLRYIASAYRHKTYNMNPRRMLAANPGDTADAAAFILAQDDPLYVDKDMYMNRDTHLFLSDVGEWVVKTDPKMNGQALPASNSIFDESDPSRMNPNFAKLPLCFVIVANIAINAPASTTPVAWTRGLRDDGTWTQDSPWQGDGGFVAFLDGHVEWFDKLRLKGVGDIVQITHMLRSNFPIGDPLYKYGTNTTTVNIHEALPPGAVILQAEPLDATKSTGGALNSQAKP
jgi:prepilin-type processing-associated H-X9-DG protein